MNINKKPIKEAVAFVIYENGAGSKVLTVKRPADDSDFPNLWSLPAGSVRTKDAEGFETAVIRAGKEKLGVELEIVRKINIGEIERKDFRLFMHEYEVKIVKGVPSVPQPFPNMTQYSEWKWSDPKELITSAKSGGLCSRLYLSSMGINWE